MTLYEDHAGGTLVVLTDRVRNSLSCTRADVGAAKARDTPQADARLNAAGLWGSKKHEGGWERPPGRHALQAAAAPARRGPRQSSRTCSSPPSTRPKTKPAALLQAI